MRGGPSPALVHTPDSHFAGGAAVAVQWVAAQPGGPRDGRAALALLGLAADADSVSITRRYRLLAKLLHPDRLGRAAAAASSSSAHAGGAGPLPGAAARPGAELPHGGGLRGGYSGSAGSSSVHEVGGAELAARAQEAFTVVAAAYQLLMSTVGGAP